RTIFSEINGPPRWLAVRDLSYGITPLARGSNLRPGGPRGLPPTDTFVYTSSEGTISYRKWLQIGPCADCKGLCGRHIMNGETGIARERCGCRSEARAWSSTGGQATGGSRKRRSDQRR